MAISIGSDPELFVTQDGEVISAIGLIGGSKDAPLPVQDGALQEDNVLAEFNIEPCFDTDTFVNRINSVVDQLHTRLGEGKSTVVKPSHTFTMPQITAGGKAAMTFGCDPDMNCWTAKLNDAPNARTLLRTAGGHVHIGYDNPSTEMSLKLAQLCDIVLGIPSVLLDTDNQRRELYGKAGACRLKPYGFEYRTLSNFWLANDDLKAWVFNVAVSVPTKLHLLDEVLAIYSPDYIQEIINTSNIDAAATIVEQFNLELPK